MRSASNINSMNSGSSGVRPLLFRRNFAVGPKDGALKPVYDTLMKNNTTYIFTIVALLRLLVSLLTRGSI